MLKYSEKEKCPQDFKHSLTHMALHHARPVCLTRSDICSNDEVHICSSLTVALRLDGSSARIFVSGPGPKRLVDQYSKK